ncbi:uncharacterized protein UV8b_04915 [Ustilaginoidea virens]|uniref:Uncharacterized protein n=1 Tax=Ustilaginoidea virens TaxID=1159556 RepID=A0A8E5HS71_USTVR|nr:uncharacterized protein UV8b_04915 [Ustilaginoidea virens]QUC20674.1 hypothetical protein UV8b_04915 [Ustilaginoidea virens]
MAILASPGDGRSASGLQNPCSSETRLRPDCISIDIDRTGTSAPTSTPRGPRSRAVPFSRRKRTRGLMVSTSPLSGIAATRLDLVQQCPPHSFRPLMKLRMPIDRASLPENKVFAAGKTWLGLNTWVKAGAHGKATEPCAALQRIMDGHHMLKVLPSLPEEAPLDNTRRDERYGMTRSKTVRRTLFSAKAGKLAVTAGQPAQWRHAVRRRSQSGQLRGAHRPRSSHERAEPVVELHCDQRPIQLQQQRDLDKVDWQMCDVSGRRDSGYSSSGMLDEDEPGTSRSDDAGRKKSEKCRVRRRAIIEVLFDMPLSSRRIFLPTFDSCLCLPYQHGASQPRCRTDQDDNIAGGSA